MKSKDATYFNPFELFAYIGEEYFCDRKEELKELQSALDNRRNLVLISMRRMGKTQLIRHWHHRLSKEDQVIPIYIDVMQTTSDRQFINRLASAVLIALEERKTIVSKALNVFKSLRPTVSVDPVTGLPEVNLDIRDDRDVGISMEQIARLLADRKERVQISIDEFQQISEYAQTVIDASIRANIVPLENTHILFCGSESHLLHALFNSAKKPLFASTQFMHLDYIGKKAYGSFIEKHFKKAGKIIEKIAVDEVLRWTRRHTFYTHFLCNQLYDFPCTTIDLEQVEQAKYRCIQHFEMTFLYYKKLLSKNQFKVVRAIAREGAVNAINSKKFLNQYGLAASTATQSVKALTKDGILYAWQERDRVVYRVYDVFFSRWLEQLSI